MTNEEFETLAYKKSPKSTKRTTFQDELQAALSLRATKNTSLLHTQDSDDEDDFLNNLLKSRKKRSDVFKASKTKSRINDFEFSDSEDKQGRKTSFLKYQGTISLDGASQGQRGTMDSCPLSGEDDLQHNDAKLTDHQPTNDSSTLLSYQSDHAPLDSSFHSRKSPGPIWPESRLDNSGDTICQENPLDADIKCITSAGTEKETPRPKPRQRIVGLSLHATETTAEDAESLLAKPRQRIEGLSLHATETTAEDAESLLAISRPQTSPPLTLIDSNACNDITDGASLEIMTTVKSCSPHLTDGGAGGEGADSCASNGFTLADSTGQQRAKSASLEKFNQESADHSVAHVEVSRASSSQSKRSNSVRSKKVKSKYMGTLKLLDCKGFSDCQPQDADSLRAAVFQEWLKRKNEQSIESINKEKIWKEQKKKEEEEKKKDAAASYEAWKKKKDELLKAKATKEKNRMRKEQRVVKEVEEKRKAAEQVFDRWKRDQDHILREKCRKQREAERKHMLKKQEEEEERKRGSQSAFSNWCEKKTDALQKKVSTERLENKNRAEEHRYIQEEKDKMALEIFEQWLAKKDLQQKRQKEERRIQVILQDSPPPPWSPPNKTIQF
ncbi:microtubule-associated protein 9 [Dunckerocampus dactyliophorus]|uniref:microtubule-associated protein 9 n=1 Tax=Dunckerocampus dactyliophorus TaxID=161453 RepID=UPI00240528F2|nr:microtubule-associated protein 9 [Dunckerocampus dactyliophorus]